MSDKFRWLQFFADGASGGDGDGGDGAATGVESGDAGRSLEDLGVPHDKAEKYRQKKAKREAAVPQPRQEGSQQNAAPDWDSFMKIPENQQRLQQMMAERGKQASEERRAAEEQKGKLNPMLKLLAEHYGIETKDGQIDTDAVIKAVTDDDLYYEDRALEKGETLNAAKQGWRQEFEAEQQKKRERETMLQQHFLSMQQQGNKLREMFPDFDLNRELQNPVFLQRTSPEGGMTVEDAFYSIHHNEIMQQQAEAIARRAKADVASTIRSGRHPRENGSSGTAVASATPNLQQMSKEQRRAYILTKYPPPR